MNEIPDNIIIITSDEGVVRGGRATRLKVDDLAENINIFLTQMNLVLEHTPQNLGKFQFVEFEVSAEITAKGSVALLGTGGEVGASGGIKFVFRRSA